MAAHGKTHGHPASHHPAGHPAHPAHQSRHHASHSGHHKKIASTHKAANMQFIKSCVIPAQISEINTGVPTSITIAQAILESGWGHHHIGKANNYFGVKAQTVNGKIDVGPTASGYVTVDTKEHTKKGKIVTISDSFRSYNSMTDSFIDHGNFIKNNRRYHKILQQFAQTGDADQFAYGLQQAGYATDIHYAELLIGIMKKYNLYQHNIRQPGHGTLVLNSQGAHQHLTQHTSPHHRGRQSSITGLS